MADIFEVPESLPITNSLNVGFSRLLIRIDKD